jgi:hypothetical protein
MCQEKCGFLHKRHAFFLENRMVLIGPGKPGTDDQAAEGWTLMAGVDRHQSLTDIRGFVPG